MNSLKEQALHGAWWSFIERFGQQAIQFVISIILARLLEPSDFGIVAMIVIFVALAQSVVDSGFGTALIQKQDATRTDESTVFWFNLGMGFLLAGLLWWAAPWIAAFYAQPLLVTVTRAVAFNVVLGSAGMVQNALMIKAMAFRQRMQAVVVALAISSLVGVWMAWNGFGVWALVAQGLVMNAVQNAGYWVMHPWRPRWIFSMDSFRSLWRFGSKMLYSGLLATLFVNIYAVVIGRLYSPAELGFYQRGRRFVTLSSHSLAHVAHQVSFPLMARLQQEPARMRRAFEKSLYGVMLAIIPAMVALAVVAPSLVRVLLGEKWMPCVPYLQILCISGALHPLHLLNLNIIVALGRSDLVLKLEVIKRLIVVTMIMLTYRHGVVGLLWGQVASSALGLGLNSYYSNRFLQCSLFAQLGAIRMVLALGACIGLVMWTTGRLIDGTDILQLAAQGAVGMVALLVFVLRAREPVLRELRGIVFSKMGMLRP